MTDREEFLEIFRTHVTRPGSEKLLDWMDSKTDFFSAPASTRFHGACDALNDLVFDFCHSALPAFALFATIIKEAREDFNR